MVIQLGLCEYVSKRARETVENIDSSYSKEYGDDHNQRMAFNPAIWMEAANPNKKGRIHGPENVTLSTGSCDAATEATPSRSLESEPDQDIHDMSEQLSKLEETMRSVERSGLLDLNPMVHQVIEQYLRDHPVPMLSGSSHQQSREPSPSRQQENLPQDDSDDGGGRGGDGDGDGDGTARLD